MDVTILKKGLFPCDDTECDDTEEGTESDCFPTLIITNQSGPHVNTGE